MKELFPGYCKKSESEIKEIWKHGIISFDANVLLNLYRYSDSTRDTILALIQKFPSQIFLPHQAALEYNRNRYEVISDQEKAYGEFLDKISQIQKDLQSSNKPPFLSSNIDKELNSIFEKVDAEVNQSIRKYKTFFKDDPIYNRLSELFKNRITNAFSPEKLNELYKEGERRYAEKIPPGYEDEKTKQGNNKYGDLILWKQVIEKASETKKNVILVTDERKTDWWWKIKDGRIMGPRQELVEEMKTDANVDILIYSSERFLSYGQLFLDEQINQQALEEIVAMKKSDLDDNKINIKLFKNKDVPKSRYEEILENIRELNNVINYMDNDFESYYQNNISKYYEGEQMDKEPPEEIRMMMEHRDELMVEREKLNDELKKYRRLSESLKDMRKFNQR